MLVHRFYERTAEFTADVLENRILKHTIWLLSRMDFSRADLRRQLRRVASAFAESSPAPRSSRRTAIGYVYTRLNCRLPQPDQPGSPSDAAPVSGRTPRI